MRATKGRAGRSLPVAPPFLALLALVLAVLAPGCDSAGGGRGAGPPSSSVARYPGVLASADGERRALASAWRGARSPAEAERVLDRGAAVFGRLLIDEILPAWNGTPWSFSGTASRPGARPIACGYFVSTVLEAAGLRVERSRLAQQTGEDIVRSLVPEERILRFRRVPLGAFLLRVRSGGDGVYVVGLDRHVGFLLVEGGRMHFHHASRSAGQVVREQAVLSSALATSSYRVAGKLADRSMMVSWLTGAAVATQTRATVSDRRWSSGPAPR